MQIIKPSPQRFSVLRLQIWYGMLIVIFGVIIIRLFYLQVIRHDFYQKAALAGQLKEYEIKAPRGVIEAHDGDKIIPIVLNEKRYTLFADPKYVKNPSETAIKITEIIGGNAKEYEEKMKADTRYSILAKKLDENTRTRLDDLKIKGIGTREEEYRTYPQGTLAAQILGFVNDEGDGKYGIEEAINEELKGHAGQLKAITDAQGVPLVSNGDNVVVPPRPGRRVLLTIDVAIQKQLEDILKTGLDNAKSKSGSAFIMDVNSGAVLALANYPSYNPAEFFKVEDARVFSNAVVGDSLEVGSVMKPLTVAAGLDTGSIGAETTYADPGVWVIDEARITNIEEAGGAATRSIRDILQLSLNTGAVYVLQQMGGGEVNEKARTTWHDYMTNRYRFGQATGIEQSYEDSGFVPAPNEGYGLNIQYANTSFGQGMRATPLQMGAALASLINGGTYYRPHLVDGFINEDGSLNKKAPEVLQQSIVRPETSQVVTNMMQFVISKNYLGYGFKNLRPEYSIGGKTGTAQISKPEGGYFEDKYNGMFTGFIGGDKPQYVIVVRVNEPGIGGYAGSKAAGPIFASITTMLMDNNKVTPKGQ
jgi:cell division protein FtsI (penicillin-binding protein 3)